MNNIRRPLGMTLIELGAVVIIIGIIVAIAIPTMAKTVERSYWQEAQMLLKAVHDGEQRYFDKEGFYRTGLGAGSPMAQWREIFVDNPNLGSIPVTFDVADGGVPGTTFKAMATRSLGVEMWIDHNGVLCFDSSLPPDFCGNWPMP